MVTLFNTYLHQRSGIINSRRLVQGHITCFLTSLLSFLAIGCGLETKKELFSLTELSGSALGTTWSVKVVSYKEFDQSDLRSEIVQNIEKAEKIFSHWRPDSELSELNHAQDTNPRSIHPRLHELIKHAEWMNRETGGAFDPTIAPLVNLWGFGPTSGSRSTIPKDDIIAVTRKLTGMDKFEVLPRNRIKKRIAGMRLDLSGSAKGEIIDQVCQLLNRWNFKNYLVEIGGEIRAHGRGKKGNNGWIVGLESGESGRGGFVSVALRDYAVATSGTYRLKKTNPKSPRNASHLLNPKTGLPVEHNLIAVNAFAPTARDADAWATALMVMGLQEGMKKAEEMNLVARFCKEVNGEIEFHYSTAYQRLFPAKNNL